MHASRFTSVVCSLAYRARPGQWTMAGVLLFACSIVGAEPAKRPLSHQDFDSWRSIDSSVLSADGTYLAYSYMPQEGDGEVVVRHLATGQEQRVTVGALPAPPMAGSERDPERPSPRRSVSISLTNDSRFAVATTFPEHQALLDAKRAKKTGNDLPHDGLVIVDLTARTTTRLSGVKSFQVPESGGAWLAYLKRPDVSLPANNDFTKSGQSLQSDSKALPLGSDLVLRALASGRETTFAHVVEYTFARDGRTLLFTVSSPNEAENGVVAVTPGDGPTSATLVSGPGRYQKITWNRTQTQVAFVSDRAEGNAASPPFSVYHWVRGAASARAVVNSATPGLPAGYTVSGDAAPTFSFDGRKLSVSTMSIRPPPDARLQDLLEDEKVSADLWRWNDDVIQPLQKVRAEKERKRSYVGVLDLANGHFQQIADPTLPEVALSDDAARAVGYDDRSYRPRIDYDGVYQDAYVVNMNDGRRQLIARELGESAALSWSPNGRWISYFHDREWFAFDVETGRTVSLTHALSVAFHDELNDLPQAPPPYGTAGWLNDGLSLLVYDRYDVWQVFPNGSAPKNLTAGFGRTAEIQLRVQVVDPALPDDDKRGIDPSRPLTLRGESEQTRATGFFRTTFTGDTAPVRLVWDDKSFRYVGRAREGDTLLLTASRFDEFPDLHTTNSTFSTVKKVSDGGAQLVPFSWGSDELIHYRSTDGVELDAMLCKPADFDPRKKYPMIVYIYERLSVNLHRFFEPAPLAVIEPSFYTSNGYVVLMPDIAYTTGHPGQSAYRCVMPAVDEVVRRGFVDEQAIGLEGHSWGGYETSYIITQTNRFRAAQAGAIVSNMTSAYGAIGESSGRSRQFKYEKTQSRMGVTPQEAPLLYIENSPVFFASQVNTPLLILHDDHDDVVPWPQAVEYFLALRRAGKEVYLLNYNNEFHSPRRRVAKEDFARRMHQFFDHFLKGVPAPDWMAHGIPYLERDAEKLRFRDTP